MEHFIFCSIFSCCYILKTCSNFVFFVLVHLQEKDQYGNEVSRLARPLPVEYLLVDVPASTPVTPLYTFTVRDDKRMFPVENRYLDGHLQDFNALSAYISNWSNNDFLEVKVLLLFHKLAYLILQKFCRFRRFLISIFYFIYSGWTCCR